MRFDRGPTASFKDFAGRMMGQMFGALRQNASDRLGDPDGHQRRHRQRRGARVLPDPERRGHGSVPAGGSQQPAA